MPHDDLVKASSSHPLVSAEQLRSTLDCHCLFFSLSPVAFDALPRFDFPLLFFRSSAPCGSPRFVSPLFSPLAHSPSHRRDPPLKPHHDTTAPEKPQAQQPVVHVCVTTDVRRREMRPNYVGVECTGNACGNAAASAILPTPTHLNQIMFFPFLFLFLFFLPLYVLSISCRIAFDRTPHRGERKSWRDGSRGSWRLGGGLGSERRGATTEGGLALRRGNRTSGTASREERGIKRATEKQKEGEEEKRKGDGRRTGREARGD